ncbi:helix-turn-helix domain-containing protein [Halostella litorea]|uniref:ArsR family transcriptional regulator n=1 Tax=Halostella litorea TaxID=2528831 RepID=UPI0010920B5E|nr:ArsR family transcriptional regulator [Halostella litorea]
MNKASDPVLEFLHEHEIGVPIGVLNNELNEGRGTIADALDEMLDRGFVKKDEDYSSYYRITERGRKYLDGEIDADDY